MHAIIWARVGGSHPKQNSQIFMNRSMTKAVEILKGIIFTGAIRNTIIARLISLTSLMNFKRDTIIKAISFMCGW